MTIKVKLYSAALLAIAMLIAVAGGSFLALTQLEGALAVSDQCVDSVSNHLQGDLMHDALRGDVLASLLATKLTPRKEVDIKK